MTNKNRVVKLAPRLSLIFYCAAFIYAVYLLANGPKSRTSFDENALLPGLVDEQFDDEYSIRDIHQTIRQFFVPDSYGNVKRLSQPAIDFLKEQFSNVGLETYVQNYTLLKGLAFSETIYGSNIFGISRSSRGYSNEAIALIVPLTPGNGPSLALALALAKFCRDQVYWAKDILFILVENQRAGMIAWIDTYYESNNPNLRSEPFSAHSGSIHAAVVLDSSQLFNMADNLMITGADIEINMINGQLPNLDFVNLCIRMLEKYGFNPTIFGQEDFWGHLSSEMVWHFAKTASLALKGQAFTGLLKNNDSVHSVFGRFGVEALTLKLMQKKYERKIPIFKIANVLEGVLRSVNNLLQKFHQSYHFYVMLSVHNFIPLAAYMPIVGLVLGPVLIRVVLIWMEISGRMKNDQDEANTKEIESEKLSFNSSIVTTCILTSVSVGVLLRFLPEMTIYIDYKIAEQILRYFPSLIATLCGICLSVPIFFLKKLDSKQQEGTCKILFAFSLVQLSIVSGVVSLLNFGLGLILCMSTVPVLLFGILNKRVKQFVLCLLIAFALVYMVIVYNNGNNDTLLMLLKDALIGWISNCYAVSDWSFTILTVGLIPAFLIVLFSILISMKI